MKARKNFSTSEMASRLEVVILNKMGTITKGKPELTEVLPLEGFAEEELLRLATITDCRSAHPPAAVISRRYSIVLLPFA